MLDIWHGRWGPVVDIPNYKLQYLREDIELLNIHRNQIQVHCHHFKTLEVNWRGWRKIAFYCIWTLCTFTVFIIFINSLNHQLVKETVYIKDNFSTFKCKQYLISHLLNCRDTPGWLRAITPCLYLVKNKRG